jgi:flagellar protein FlaG
MEISSVREPVIVVDPIYQRPVNMQAEDRELIHAVKKINEAELLGSDSELTFILDRETRKPLVRIIDRETKEVIRQIPPEYVLRLASGLLSPARE